MTAKNKSIFNLIEIFRSTPKRMITAMVSKTHCQYEHMHDYYCDAEKPYIG